VPGDTDPRQPDRYLLGARVMVVGDMEVAEMTEDRERKKPPRILAPIESPRDGVVLGSRPGEVLPGEAMLTTSDLADDPTAGLIQKP
jgi:hypothetical protein